MIITLSLKYCRDIILPNVKIGISKIHLISTTPSLIRGYGGYGWLIETNNEISYKLFKKNVVIDGGIITSKEIIRPKGGKVDDYYISINL